MVWSKDRRSYNLYVNHRLSDSCGKCVRGLLCKTCNSGLGHFKDNLGIVMSAVRYLSEQTYFELEDSFELSPLSYSNE